MEKNAQKPKNFILSLLAKQNILLLQQLFYLHSLCFLWIH